MKKIYGLFLAAALVAVLIIEGCGGITGPEEPPGDPVDKTTFTVDLLHAAQLTTSSAAIWVRASEKNEMAVYTTSPAAMLLVFKSSLSDTKAVELKAANISVTPPAVTWGTWGTLSALKNNAENGEQFAEDSSSSSPYWLQKFTLTTESAVTLKVKVELDGIDEENREAPVELDPSKW